APPNAPALGLSYGTKGSFIESSGFVTLDSAHAVLASAAGTTPVIGQFATLLTDNTTDNSTGLKKANNFSVDGRFDLILPNDLQETYGIRLTDRIGDGAGQLGNDTLELAV